MSPWARALLALAIVADELAAAAAAHVRRSDAWARARAEAIARRR